MGFVSYIKKQRINLFLVIFLGFSFFLRIWQLDINPAGFFCDEALRGVDAISVLKTGRDSNGDRLPLFFKGFNFENVGPFNVYPVVPFIVLFGLTEKAVRITPVFWSTVEILIFFLFLKGFIPKKFALIGSLLLAISPWHFHLSRVMFTDSYAWTLTTLIACFFLVQTFRKRQIRYIILTSVFFGLATYSYIPSRLITPLLFILTITLILIKKGFKKTILMIIVYFFILIPLLYFHLSQPKSFQRFKETVGIDIKSQQVANISKQDFTKKFIYKYALHYSDTFLFIKGDADSPDQPIKRHSIVGLGLLYPYQKWLIIIGLVYLIDQIIRKKKFELLFIIFLFLLFPVADSLTTDLTPFATRSYLGVLPFHILIIMGIYAIYQTLIKLALWRFKLVKLVFVLTLLFFIETSYFTLITKFNQNPLYTSGYWGWQFGPRDIISYFKEVKNDYDELIMEPAFNAPDIFFKFYAPNDCQKCLVGNLDSYNSAKKQLFAVTPETIKLNPEISYTTKKVLYYPNREVAFIIIKVL